MENHEHCEHCQGHGHEAQQKNELETLKTEITSKLDNKEPKASLPWGSLAVTIVLGILALVSIAQMAQTVSVYNKIKSGDLKSTGTPAPSSVDSQPSMVGGC
ncbi:MAG: hypothetical protein AAB348_01980 [Patescibacteria group bacterium]